MPHRSSDGLYTYRGCWIGRTRKGWEILPPGGTPTPPPTQTIRQAYQVIDRLPGIPAKADKRAAGSLGGKAFHAKYRLQPVGTSDFAIVNRQTGQAVRTMNGYYIPARSSQ